jgi:hypothetical protein
VDDIHSYVDSDGKVLTTTNGTKQWCTPFRHSIRKDVHEFDYEWADLDYLTEQEIAAAHESSHPGPSSLAPQGGQEIEVPSSPHGYSPWTGDSNQSAINLTPPSGTQSEFFTDSDKFNHRDPAVWNHVLPLNGASVGPDSIRIRLMNIVTSFPSSHPYALTSTLIWIAYSMGRYLLPSAISSVVSVMS